MMKVLEPVLIGADRRPEGWSADVVGHVGEDGKMRVTAIYNWRFEIDLRPTEYKPCSAAPTAS